MNLIPLGNWRGYTENNSFNSAINYLANPVDIGTAVFAKRRDSNGKLEAAATAW